MAELEIRSTAGAASGRNVDLPDQLFGREVDHNAVHQSVLAHQQNQTQARGGFKTRAQVRGGGAKPWRQKGTGRARQGSIRAPHFAGGGVVFGPGSGRKRRKLPKRIRRAAVCSALSDKQNNEAVIVAEPLDLEEPKTKRVAEFIDSLGLTGKRILFILDEERPTFYKSARNIPGVEIRVTPNFAAYEVLWAEAVVLFEGAVEKLAEVWA